MPSHVAKPYAAITARLDSLMLEAKSSGCPWVEGLEYAIVAMGG